MLNAAHFARLTSSPPPSPHPLLAHTSLSFHIESLPLAATTITMQVKVESSVGHGAELVVRLISWWGEASRVTKRG